MRHRQPSRRRTLLNRTQAVRAWLRSRMNAVVGPVDRQHLARALRVLQSRQTSEERAAHATIKQNGIGYNGVDAPFAASLIDWHAQHNDLTIRQAQHAARLLVKYARQLAEEAINKEAAQ